MAYRKILLIDDDEDDQEIFLTALARVTTSVVCDVMSDAGSALQKLSEKLLSPDVIFLDLNMPVMNGQQFLVEIKKEPDLQHIPIIIFSTSSHQPTIYLTKTLGAKDFITKPERFEDLLHILKSIIIG